MATEEAEIAEVKHTIKSLFITDDRKHLVRNNGEEVNAEDHLKGKTVGVYFSAHWCGPCRRFTPTLVEAYNEINENPSNGFEVVFVSADDDEEAFEKYFQGMPWLAVPYSDSGTREQLNKAFEVNGIPHLAIIDGTTAAFVPEDVVEAVSVYGADAYPFTMERLKQLSQEEEAARRNQTLKSVLTHPKRDYVVNSSDENVPVSDLEGKMVGILFSANSHGGCMEFAPVLVKLYKELKERGETFEVVLVSLDGEEEDFQEAKEKMPWLALPFEDKSTGRLVRYFELQALPTLVLIGPDGKTITCEEDVAELVEEHGVAAYPFSPEVVAKLIEEKKRKDAEQTLESLLVSDDLDYVIGKANQKVPVKDLDGKTVLIYFSAHWCPPCRAFTPKLAKVYEDLKEKGRDIEVVFVSSDQDQSSFEEYYSSMPWLALPFGDKRKGFLSRKFKVQGIPTLVAISKTGRTASTDARGLVMAYGDRAYPFTEERVKELEEEAVRRASSWPEKVTHSSHEHELTKTTRRGYVCDGCKEGGQGWSYWCKQCDFDLHPKCAGVDKETEDGATAAAAAAAAAAAEEENSAGGAQEEDGGGEEENGGGEEKGEGKGETKEGYVCEDGVCRKA